MRLPRLRRRDRAASHDASPSTPPAFGGLYTAGATGAVVLLLALIAISPWTRVERVVWTGAVRIDAARYLRLEAASLGSPLLLLSELRLRRALGPETDDLRIRLHRHLPSTLEVRLEARRARVQLDDGTALDERGRVVAAPASVAGLPRLRGFPLAEGGKSLEARAARLYRELRPLLEQPALVPESIALEAEDLRLVLAETGAQVRLDAARAPQQIHKLRVFERSLGGEMLPESIDLRFQDQVVVRSRGGRRAPGRP